MDTSADRSDVASADGRWVSYPELAAIRDIDLQSARRLTARQGWRRQKDNHGVVRVYVPLEHLQGQQDALADTVDAPAVASADVSAAIVALESAVAALREQLTAANSRAGLAEARATRAEEAVAGERVRADMLWDQLKSVQAELRWAQQQAEALRQAEAERKARGRWTRLRDAWRGP